MPSDPKKSKKSKSGKKSKKSKKSSSGTATPVPPTPAVASSQDFGAGQLFERYAGQAGGFVDRSAFLQMVNEMGLQPPPPAAPGAAGPAPLTPRTDFDAGRLFARYDAARQGKLDRAAFQQLMGDLNTTAGGGMPTAPPATAPAVPGALTGTGAAPAYGWSAPAAPPASAPLDFEHGRVFQQYDASGSGALGPDQFRAFVHDARRGQLGGSAPPAPPQHTGQPMVGPWASSFPPPSAPYGTGMGIYGSVGPSTSLAVVPTGYAPGPPPPDATLGSLGEAYHTRLHSLSVAQANLMAKREAMLYQLAKLRARAEEVAGARRAIERETLADTEAILHRLRSAEALKQSLLRHDMDGLAGDIASIDKFAATLASHTAPPAQTGAAPSDTLRALAAGGQAVGQGGGVHALGAAPGEVAPATALEFMREYPGLCSEADRLLAKPVNTAVPVQAEDFERETASRLALVTQVQALQELNDSKTSVIEALLREREAAAADVAAITEASNSEVQQWVELTDKLTEQLAKAQATAHLGEGSALGQTAVSDAAPES